MYIRKFRRLPRRLTVEILTSSKQIDYNMWG